MAKYIYALTRECMNKKLVSVLKGGGKGGKSCVCGLKKKKIEKSIQYTCAQDTYIGFPLSIKMSVPPLMSVCGKIYFIWVKELHHVFKQYTLCNILYINRKKKNTIFYFSMWVIIIYFKFMVQDCRLTYIKNL